MGNRRVQQGEVILNVVEEGDPAHPGILFLHGFPDCHGVWSHQMEALCEHYHVIAPDMRGAGDSSAPSADSGFRIEAILPDIEAVIRACRGEAGRVHLVGHDWGSIIGWSVIAEPGLRERILSWTSLSGPPLAQMWGWAADSVRADPVALRGLLDQLLHSWYVFALQLPGLGRGLFGAGGARLWRRAMRQGGVPADDPYLAITSRRARSLTLEPLKLYRQNALRASPRPFPGSIRVPTRLVVLEQDAFVRPQVLRGLEAWVEELDEVHLGANHWAQRSHPREVTRLIREFVEQVEARTATGDRAITEQGRSGSGISS